MLILVQNDETRSKLDKIRAGPTQIDPRGSNGPLKSENRSYYAGEVLKNPGWLSGDPTDIPKVAACVHFVRPRAIARARSDQKDLQNGPSNSVDSHLDYDVSASGR